VTPMHQEVEAAAAAEHGPDAGVPLASVATAVITVSDRRAAGTAEDTAGPAVADALRGAGALVDAWIVPDGVAPVQAAIDRALASGARIVITVGGTGVSPRDLTPEATAPFLSRHLPGIPELIRAAGAATAPAAALSRGLAGITAGEPGTVIINVPGSQRGALESLQVTLPLLPHLLSQLEGGDHS